MFSPQFVGATLRRAPDGLIERLWPFTWTCSPVGLLSTMLWKAGWFAIAARTR
jgi:hypothetical protein